MTTVLVVDDSRAERLLAGGLLQKSADWNVVYASNGQEAIVQLEVQSPDVVITDLVMPKMNGRELVQTMQGEFPHTPVIIMTSKGNEQVAVKTLELGAASYVPKKRLAQDLIATVNQVLSRSQEARSDAKIMTRLTVNDTTFEIKNDPDLVRPLVGHFQQMMQWIGLCEDTELQNVASALEEALLNAVYHGNFEVNTVPLELDRDAYIELAVGRRRERPYRERRVHLEANLSEIEATFRIRDEGPGFDTSAVADILAASDVDQPKGQGLLLIHTFMDEIAYNAAGNEVTLVKRKARLPASESANL